ncbi:MAG: protein kinase [Gemmatimonadetes bacterium]|nr:protein kinase [Gemmatimonadota bacterium]
MDKLEDRLQSHLGTAYRIQVELGGGGMSRVFVAEEVALARPVVIKLLHPTLAATVSAERFQREILVVASLNHPNIVPVLSAGDVGGLPYFTMPFIEGESLRARITRGPLSVREALGVLKDVARALAYAHNAGIVHRDIKPANILLTGSAAVVADFGVAKAVSAARDRGVVSGTAITGIGISLGTPQYMAPEQAAADPNADHRVDLYALGIIAYEMLTGSPPFYGRTPQALLAAQLTELPKPVASRRNDIPVGLASLVMQCLEKNPTDRPRNVADVVRMLESPDTISGPVARSPRAASMLLRRRLQAAAYVGIPSALAIAAVLWGLAPSKAADADTGAPAVPAALVASASASASGAAAVGAMAAAELRTVAIVTDGAIGAGSGDVAAGIVAALEPGFSGGGYRVTVVRAGSLPPTDSTTLVVHLTVQREGDRARATLRMTRGSSADAVWSDRFDFAVAQSFEAQDSMVARAIGAAQRTAKSASGMR